MEITGTITDVLPVQSGVSASGKDWKKQSFVLLTDEQYPQTVLLTLFGKSLENYGSVIEVNAKVLAEFSLSSSKWEKDGKVSWFTNVNVYKVASLNQSQSVSAMNPTHPMQKFSKLEPAIVPQVEEDDDLPF